MWGIGDDAWGKGKGYDMWGNGDDMWSKGKDAFGKGAYGACKGKDKGKGKGSFDFCKGGSPYGGGGYYQSVENCKTIIKV